jgi:hypothetical protein
MTRDDRREAVAKFVLAYQGGGMPETEAEQQAVMEAWMNWFGQLGESVVDGGNPFGASKAIASDGSVQDGGTASLTGYSIVDAASLDDAVTKAKGCPVLTSGGSIDVYESMDIG